MMDDADQQETTTQGEEQQPGLVFDGGKKGQLFVLDYGEHMFADGEWRFRLALKALRGEINKMCCRGDNNELGAVIFVNTSVMKNVKDLECIFVHRNLGTMDADYVKQLDGMLTSDSLRREFEPTLGESATGDWTQIFFLLQTILQFSGHVLRKKTIKIFTTDNIETIHFDMDSLNGARTRVNDELHPKGVDIKVFLLEEDREDTELTSFWKSIDPELSRYTTYDDLNEGLHFKNYALRSTTALPFVLGEGFKFAVGLYYLVKTQLKPPAILMDSETNERVEQRTHYLPKDADMDEEEKTQVADNPDLIPGAIGEGEVFEGEVNFTRDVGGVGVVMDREEFEKLRRFDQPGITVIGFKPLCLLKASHRMSSAKFIYPLDTVMHGSKKIYKTLLKKCIERELFILVRYTQKTNTPPQLCALVAQSHDTAKGNEKIAPYIYEGFHLLELPFAEEARDLRERYKTPDGLGAWPAANGEQIEVAKKFIDQLTWDFSPDQFANPVLQRHYKAVETIALDLDVDTFLEEAEKFDTLKPYFKTEENARRVAPTLEKLKELCSADRKAMNGGGIKREKEDNDEEGEDEGDGEERDGRKTRGRGGARRPPAKRGRKAANAK